MTDARKRLRPAHPSIHCLMQRYHQAVWLRSSKQNFHWSVGPSAF